MSEIQCSAQFIVGMDVPDAETVIPMSHNDVELLADLLRHWRAAAELTQEELAERAGLSRRLISDLERGIIKAPHKDTVMRLLKALNLNEKEREMFISAAPRRRGFARGAGAGTAASSGDIPALIGRSHEMAVIERHLSRTDVAQPSMLVVGGEPGVGKSRLLCAAARRGRAIGWTVVQGGCTRRNGQEPFAPFAETLEHALAHLSLARQRTTLQGGEWLARLLPELVTRSLVSAPHSTLPPDQERRLLFAAIKRLLANLADSAGTLLVLDDMQWASTDALDLLTELVGNPFDGHRSPVACICAYRSTEVGHSHPFAHCLTELASRGAVSRIDLGPLSEEEAADLLEHLLARQAIDRPFASHGSQPIPQSMSPLSAEVRQQVLQRAEGMPFYLVSAARELCAQHSGDVEGGWKVPWPVAQSVRARTWLLPRQARQLLEAAAVIGRVVPSSILVPLVSGLGDPLDEDAIVSALETACDAGLLVERDSTYLFAHDLIREVTLADLSSARARALHRRVAEILKRLEKAGLARRAANIAYHFLQAEEPARALPHMLQAGEQALSVYAFTDAEQQFRAAVDLTQQLGDKDAEAAATEQLGTALAWLTRIDEAFAVLEPVIAEAERRGDLERLVRLEWLLSGLGAERRGSAEWVTRLLALIETTKSEGARPEIVELWFILKHWYWTTCQYAEQLRAAESALQVACVLGDASLIARARGICGHALASVGQLEEGLDELEAALLQEVQEPEELDHQQFTLNSLGWVLLLLGRTGEALSQNERALAVIEPTGAADALAWSSAQCSFIAFVRGDWSAAHRYLDQGVALRPRLRSSVRALASLYEMESQLQFAQGELKAAIQSAESGLAVLQHFTGSLRFRRSVQQLLAEIDLEMGNPAAARTRLLPLLDQPGLVGTDVNALLLLVAWVDLALGEVEEAGQLATHTVAWLREHHDRFHLVEALRVEAAVWIRQQRWAEAEAVLEETLTLARAMPYPYAEAKLLATYGDLMVACGQQERARDQYAAALAILRSLGEVPYAERIQRALVKMPRH